jgi:hypothetical protein
MSQLIRDAFIELIANGSDPADIATAVRDAIVENKFWILTHPEFGEHIVDRFTGAAEGRNPTPSTLA